jgi:methionyl-tRNA synthetase
MKRIIVTSALPFANGQMHIGQIAGCYLPADIYVKYQKLRQRDVIHVCGTDEHGVAISMKASKEQTTPQEIVDRYYPDIKSSLEQLGIEYTNFSRTTRQLHYKNAQEFFLKLHKKGYMTPKTSDQLYCDRCKRFLPERFVEGTCPYCDSPDARGDQCEKCGRWLEPTMLKEPRCQMCGATPGVKSTKHWFFRLDLLQPQLEEWIKTKEGWRDNVTKFVSSWLKEGLEPRPVTRDISWGVPVPLKEAEGKVIYVWFENLIGYISSTIECNQEHWQDYWTDKENELVCFIAKDNIVFHAINWPAMLMAHGDYVLPTQVPANEFLNIGGKKISTSRNWAVWLPDYLEDLDPDPLRYVLTMNAPEKGDVDFTWDDFLTKNNDELSDILGNFIHRTLSFVTKHLQGKVPYCSESDYRSEDKELLGKIETTRDEVGAFIEKFEFKKALKTVMALTKEGNRYFDYNKPWEKSDATPVSINVCTTLIANLSVLLQPFLPFAAKSIREVFTRFNPPQNWDTIGKFRLPEGMSIGSPTILFRKLDKERIAVQEQKLGASSEKADEKKESSMSDQKEMISYNDFEKLDLRVAEVVEATRVEGTKKLVKLKILLGEETRQIVAGLAEAYSPEQLVGKRVTVLINLEPRKIRGELSNGMLLAATHEDKITVLTPDQDIPPGSPVS